MINEFAEEKKEKGMANLVRKVCFGKYKQYVCCTECMNVVISYFNFLDVILPIPDTHNPDLAECFQHFAMYDTLDKNNKWDCTTCKKKVVAHKKMEIHEVPEVAIFTLNRFIGTVKNNTPVKLYHRIELEGKKLKLIATVNHYGNKYSGHYVAHVSRDDNWYVADDSSIRESTIATILNDASVYMMIYQLDC
jgi:ubiquitin carboxyl-terminal hydrolase 36/42